jgi:hypothetical protein
MDAIFALEMSKDNKRDWLVSGKCRQKTVLYGATLNVWANSRWKTWNGTYVCFVEDHRPTVGIYLKKGVKSGPIKSRKNTDFLFRKNIFSNGRHFCFRNVQGQQKGLASIRKMHK